MNAFLDMYQSVSGTDCSILMNLSELMECYWEATDATSDQMSIIIAIMEEINAEFYKETEPWEDFEEED